MNALALAGLAAIALATGASIAEAAVGGCAPNRVKFRTETSLLSTQVTSFVRVSDTKITIGGTTPSCVIAVFSAVATGEGTSMEVRAQILLPETSAVITGQPPVVVFIGPSSDLGQVHSMQFVFPTVPPGTQRVRIQFRSRDEGNTVRLLGRTLTIHYK